MGAETSKVLKESPTLSSMNDPAALPQYNDARPKWTGDVHADVQPRLAEKGIASKRTERIQDYFKTCAEMYGSRTALRVERTASGTPPADGRSTDAVWKEWTWAEYYRESRDIAKTYSTLGLQARDGVCLWGFNAPEWHIAQMGAAIAGGVVAGIYPTDNRDQVQYKAFDANAAVAVVQEKKHVEVFASLSKDGKLPKLKAIIYWTPSAEAVPSFQNDKGEEVRVMPWLEGLNHGVMMSDEQLDEQMAGVTTGSCTAIIFTSGTTGRPKGVMLSHDNLAWECLSIVEMIFYEENRQALHAQKGRAIHTLSYLPLSHVAGCILDIVAPIVATVVVHPWTVSFARASDLKEGTLKDRLTDVRPTIFLGVPRVWEKIQEGMLAARAKKPPGCCLAKMIDNAKASGSAYAHERELGGTGKSPGCYKAPCNQAVFKKAKNALGLDQCIYAVSGAAPIQQSTVDYFGALGILINDVYGMSEGTAVICISSQQARLPGSCGAAVAGAEVAILQETTPQAGGQRQFRTATVCPPGVFDSGNIPEEHQGEICYRARSVMMGYLANPAWGADHVANLAKQNAEAIDADGWLHSGDKGTMCTRGMFKITGRYKELIIGAGGENIAPVPIENAIKQALGGQGGVVSNVMMVGDKRKFNTCLITLTCEGATGEKAGTDVLAGGAAAATSAKTIKEACEDKTFTDKIVAAITKVNKDGSVCPSAASRVGKFTILPIDLSVDGDEFTPTLKVKRKVVEAKYAAAIEAMYAPEAEKMAFVPYKA